MSLFGRKEQQEIENLRAQLTAADQELEHLRAMMSPEHQTLADLQTKIENSSKQLHGLQSELKKAQIDLAAAKNKIIETDEAALLQSFGIYTPHYSYSTSDEYKSHLKIIRDRQKETIKSGRAVRGNHDWTVNGSASKGKKMVSDMQKLLLRAFNAECDDAIEHVRFNNIEACEKKIRSSADAISKLGSMMQISITNEYLNLKLNELHLMHEYQVKKQDEKDAAKELRARQREEAKAQRELEDARKKLEKEQSHYENELSRLNARIATASDSDRLELEAKRSELEARLGKIDDEMKDVDYRAANQRAGYVYVISNIGAFGENVYKIGMTRRLDPMERVDELGDASVPFNFDVHAMIFTEDAPGLEAALHNAFTNRKLNFVNQRREFFNVSLDEIKTVIRQNYDKTVDFVDIPPAEQYRESLLLRADASRN